MVKYNAKQAIMSLDSIYRYELIRCWNNTKPTCVFIMLNPSTADGFEDDATIRRCVGLADANGFGNIIVYNLFALRATNPKELKTHADPIGPLGDEQFTDIDAKHTIICAWGRHGSLHGRDKDVMSLLKGRELFCFGVNKDGSPKHPLYLRADVILEKI